MQTQRDHVHAHQFVMGRTGCALVQGDPSTAEPPGRRALTGVLSGIAAAALVLAAFAVYGWIVPGGSAVFNKPNLILVEKESGTRYVYLDGVLRPTPDLASALLIQGSRSTIKLISRSSLKGLPRGAAIGVPGAPPTLPGSGDMVRGPWLACLPDPVTGAGGPALGIDLDPAAPARPMPAGQYAVVRAGKGTTWLVAGDRRYRIGSDAVLVALGGAGARAVPAPDPWLGWIPEGVPLAPARIPGAGRPGPQVGGTTYPVGTVFRQRTGSGTGQSFVLRQEGLAPLSRTEDLLLEAAGRQVVEADTATVATAPQSPDRSLTTRLPDLAGARWADPAGRVLCLRQQPVTARTYRSAVVFADPAAGALPDRGSAGVAGPAAPSRAAPSRAAPSRAAVSPAGSTGPTRGAGRTVVLARPGSGMVVLPVPLPTGPGAQPTPWFISETGVAYPVPDTQSMAALKFDSAPLVPFPQDLLAKLPRGPALTRASVTELDGKVGRS